MMAGEFIGVPIVLGTNPHTGNPEGDDTGYRNLPVSKLDGVNPDPMVFVEKYGLPVRPVYFMGAIEGLCPYYGAGIGGMSKVLLRKPVVLGLVEVQEELARLGRGLVVLDGFRPAQVQAKLWRSIYKQILEAEGKDWNNLSFADHVRIGLKADEVGSYYPPLRDEAYHMQARQLLLRPEVVEAAASLGMEVGEFVGLYLAFAANRDLQVPFDLHAQTAHGGGGAVDVWTINQDTGRYCNLGVPFDYVASPGCPRSPAEMDYFDRDDFSVDAYRAEIQASPALAQYLAELGVTKVTQALCGEIRYERRVLFHVMKCYGASFYNGECWHFQFGNEREGNQADSHPGYGNTCHGILNGHKEAIWGNYVGHKLARQLAVF